jgi:hypothetical protein
MRSVADEYEFVDGVDEIWSVGGHSEEWLRETFTNGPEEEVRETAYVSGNPFTENVADLNFAALDDLNELDYGVDSPVAPAHVVTDRAIAMGRSESLDRQIVHYMQPHRPFFARGEQREDVSIGEWSMGTDLYHSYFDGAKTKGDLHQGYVENLRYVLEEVRLLLENVDAEDVIITADHGHAIGERFLWDHRQGIQHPVMRRVPWVETTASDRGTLNPTEYRSRDQSATDVENQLRALGYK